jgi:hypothetical protein
MHKGHEQTQDDEAQCRLRNACDPSAALLTICGAIAILPAASSTAADRAPEVLPRHVLNLIARAELPDAPPPRS